MRAAVTAAPPTEGLFPSRPAALEFLGLLGEPEAPERGLEVHAGLEEVAKLAGLRLGSGGFEADAVCHVCQSHLHFQDMRYILTCQ